MRKSKILKKLREGKCARISALAFPVDVYPTHAARAGYDGIWLESEHHLWDPLEIRSFIALHHIADIDCVFRPPTTEKTPLYQYLECGATGLLIPHVSTPEKARRLVDAVKFPPLGDRGMGAAGLDNNHFVDGVGNYPEDANRETLLVVQIETLEALDNVEAIAGVEGVDVLFIGPGDLALRLGCDFHFGEPKMQEAQSRIAAAAEKHGKAWGRPCSGIEDVEAVTAEGARFIVYGVAFGFMADGLRAAEAALDSVLGAVDET